MTAREFKAKIRCVAMLETKGEDTVDLVLQTTLPFIPQSGMWIAFNEGDYFKVDSVYWCSSKPDEIEVFLDEPDSDDRLPSAAMLQAVGWVES